MSTRFRDRDRREETPAPGAPAPAGSEEVRERARRLLDAGDEAIHRALSSDSETFLAQNRQQGGE